VKGRSLSQVYLSIQPDFKCVLGRPQRLWYAVHTRSNFEKRVAVELGLKGIETFLPSFCEVHRWKDRKKTVEIPYFASYVFVRIEDSPEQRLDVLRTSGTVRLLGSRGEIEPIPDLEIENLQLLVESSLSACAHPFLKEGSTVRVKSGPLRGIEGLLVQVKNQNRLILSLNLLARSVATEIDLCDVELIRPAAN
jgi:transcription antitermination factor NusG